MLHKILLAVFFLGMNWGCAKGLGASAETVPEGSAGSQAELRVQWKGLEKGIIRRLDANENLWSSSTPVTLNSIVPDQVSFSFLFPDASQAATPNRIAVSLISPENGEFPLLASLRSPAPYGSVSDGAIQFEVTGLSFIRAEILLQSQFRISFSYSGERESDVIVFPIRTEPEIESRVLALSEWRRTQEKLGLTNTLTPEVIGKKFGLLKVVRVENPSPYAVTIRVPDLVSGEVLSAHEKSWVQNLDCHLFRVGYDLHRERQPDIIMGSKLRFVELNAEFARELARSVEEWDRRLNTQEALDSKQVVIELQPHSQPRFFGLYAEANPRYTEWIESQGASSILDRRAWVNGERCQAVCKKEGGQHDTRNIRFARTPGGDGPNEQDACSGKEFVRWNRPVVPELVGELVSLPVIQSGDNNSSRSYSLRYSDVDETTDPIGAALEPWVLQRETVRYE